VSLFDNVLEAKSAEELIQHYRQVRSRLIKKTTPEQQRDELAVAQNLSEHEALRIVFCEEVGSI
jgi:hypothetical protein